MVQYGLMFTFSPQLSPENVGSIKAAKSTHECLRLRLSLKPRFKCHKSKLVSASLWCILQDKLCAMHPPGLHLENLTPDNRRWLEECACVVCSRGVCRLDSAECVRTGAVKIAAQHQVKHVKST
ncbi:uncharacterized protein V6R79_004991 [Siganus canaliculatus]